MKKIKSFVVLFVFFPLICCSFVFNFGLKTVGAAEKQTIQSAVGSDCSVSDFSQDGKESVRLQIKNNEYAGVWLSLPTLVECPNYSRVHIDFGFYIEGDTNTYSDIKIVDSSKNIVDGGFAEGVWHRVNFDATVYERNSDKCVFIGVINGKDSNVFVSDVKISDDVYSLNNCFDGDILWQLEPNRIQMEGYVWRTATGKIIVIDGGDAVDAERLLRKIREYKNEVDGWFISHFHRDHVGALISILSDEDIYIKNLYYDFEVKEEILSTDSEFVYIEKLNDAVNENRHKIGNVVTTKKGDSFDFDRLTFKVLNDAYFGSATNLGNDSTVVFKVETAGESVLFLGDIAQYGDVLIQDDYFLNEAKTCEIVQMAHHGQNGVNDDFYRQLSAMKVCLYPAPAWLFNCDERGLGINSSPEYKSLKTRALMRELGVRYSFSSEYGRVKLG